MHCGVCMHLFPLWLAIRITKMNRLSVSDLNADDPNWNGTEHIRNSILDIFYPTQESNYYFQSPLENH